MGIRSGLMANIFGLSLCGVCEAAKVKFRNKSHAQKSWQLAFATV